MNDAPTTHEERRVVVAGAGIGGLAAAIAARRAGFGAMIVERDARPRNHGGALMLWSNATSALRELGVLEAVLARAQPVERAIIQSSRGARLTELDLGRVGRALGSPCVVVSRRALHQVLLGALPEGTLRTGAPCAGFCEREGRVDVQLEGGEVVRAEVLVGADGLRSRVRAALNGDEPPREARQTAWLGVARSTLLPRGETRAILGPGRRFWCTRVGRSRTYWYAVIADELLAPPTAGRGAAFSPTKRGASRFPASLFDGWPACVATLVEATEKTTRVRVADRPPISRWGEGLVTLLGDAAHPTTPDLGQGACQALESAAALARALAGATDLAGALRGYERARRGRAEMFTNISYIAATSTASGSRARQALAELALAATPPRLSEQRLVSLLARGSVAG